MIIHIIISLDNDIIIKYILLGCLLCNVIQRKLTGFEGRLNNFHLGLQMS